MAGLFISDETALFCILGKEWEQRVTRCGSVTYKMLVVKKKKDNSALKIMNFTPFEARKYLQKRYNLLKYTQTLFLVHDTHGERAIG